MWSVNTASAPKRVVTVQAAPQQGREQGRRAAHQAPSHSDDDDDDDDEVRVSVFSFVHARMRS
jgi:hypothetical protein